ncbi:MAG: M6 family metalloprotease domain-containing protein, partial [Thermoplasmata archaeon]
MDFDESNAPLSTTDGELNDESINDFDDDVMPYELLHPEDEEYYTDEFIELTEKIRENNLENGWSNAGPPWYMNPLGGDNDPYQGLPGTRAPSPKPAPPGGKLLVIFINFTDSKNDTINHKPDIRDTEYFNETVIFNTSTGANTMANWFDEVSYHKYNLTGYCAKNSSNTNGWYTASRNESYYGKYEMNPTPPMGYGNARDLVTEAIKLADPDINYTEYDTNNDTVIDHLMVVHAGLDDATDGDGTGPSGDPQIWSHKWGVTVFTDDLSYNGVTKVRTGTYTMLAEMSKMGVYVHEFGHDLGLPDLYDTTKATYPVRSWDVMASGAYNTNKTGVNKPAHFSTWCKEFLGWHQPIVINETNNNQGIKTVRATSGSTNDSTSYKINLPDSQEWFYVENRWNDSETFDSGLKEGGILIWHFDDTKNNNAGTIKMLRPENANPSKSDLSDAAYSLEDSQDLFNRTSSPNSSYNNNTLTNIHMDMINNSGPYQRIRILLTGDPFPPGVPTIKSVRDVPGDNGNTLNVTWTNSSDDGGGSRDVKCYNLYINDTGEGPNGNKYLVAVIPATEATNYTYFVTGLADGVIYHFSVRADDGPNESPWSNNASNKSSDNIANPPTSLVASDTSNDDGGNITLSWTLSVDDGSDILGYNISMDGNFIETVWPGNSSYKIGNLTNGITYSFNITAFDEVYNIGISNNDTAQPADDYVGSPTGIAATPVSWTNTNSFTVSWTNPKDNSGITGAYFKLDTYPTSPTDGDYRAGAGITQITGISVVGSGVHPIYVWLVDGEDNKNQLLNDTTNLYYDNLAPDAPLDVKSTPSNWTNVNSFDINWTNPSDMTDISG